MKRFLIGGAIPGRAGIMIDAYTPEYMIQLLDENESMPVHCAAQQGHKEIIILLLKKGANGLAKSSNGFTMLHWAASTGKNEIIKFLIDNNFPKQEKDKEGKTALQIAMENDHKNIIALLQ